MSGVVMVASALGWIGTAGTLGAYFLLSRGKLSVNSLTYAVVNVVGSLLAGFASAAFGAWPSVAANVLWALISGRTLVVALRRPALRLLSAMRRRQPLVAIRQAARRSVDLRFPA